MRTTLMIHDELYMEVKRVASGRRTSVSQVVNDALRRELDATASTQKRPPVRIPVFGGAHDPRVDTSPAEFDAMLNEESGAQ
jgi:Arc/MetJ-type ribon-helix-helix transcriptional regulator